LPKRIKKFFLPYAAVSLMGLYSERDKSKKRVITPTFRKRFHDLEKGRFSSYCISRQEFAKQEARIRDVKKKAEYQ